MDVLIKQARSVKRADGSVKCHCFCYGLPSGDVEIEVAAESAPTIEAARPISDARAKAWRLTVSAPPKDVVNFSNTGAVTL